MIFCLESFNILISNTSGVPIYEQIEEQIKTQIMNGSLSAGDTLPSMRALAKDLKISIITTKRAYEDLERDGFIANVQGKGCFVKAMNAQLIKETMLFEIQELFESATEKALIGRISLGELTETLGIIYKEKNNG